MSLLQFCLAEGLMRAPWRSAMLGELSVMAMLEGPPPGWDSSSNGVVVREGAEGPEVVVARPSGLSDEVFVPFELADRILRAPSDEMLFDELLDLEHTFGLAITEPDFLAWHLYRDLEVIGRDEMAQLEWASGWRLYLRANDCEHLYDETVSDHEAELLRTTWRRARLAHGWLTVANATIDVDFGNSAFNETWTFGVDPVPDDATAPPKDVAAYCSRYGRLGLDVIAWLALEWLDSGRTPPEGQPLKVWQAGDGALLTLQDFDYESRGRLEHFADVPVEVIDSLLGRIASTGLVSTVVSITSLGETDPTYLRGHLARVHNTMSEDLPVLECEVVHLTLHS